MSVNREDFKTSGSFINPFDLSFMLWKYKLEVRRCAVLKRGGGNRPTYLLTEIFSVAYPSRILGLQFETCKFINKSPFLACLLIQLFPL